MVRNFRGQVKVSDIQAAFDDIINRINTAVDKYNTAIEVYGVDFNVGKDNIGSPNQTLSIGGLKKILDAYDGSVLGCKVFRVDENKALVAGGFVIKSRTVYKLPSKTVTISESTTTIYYDTSDEAYYTASGNNRFELCKINTLSTNIMLNRPKALSEKFPQWRLKIADNAIGSENNKTFTKSTGKFIGGIAGRNGQMSLLGDKDSSNRATSYHRWGNDSSDCYWENFNFFWVPKGLNNPYEYVGGESRFKSEHVWNEIVTYDS